MKAGWEDRGITKGIREIACPTWNAVLSFFADENYESHAFVWRGHSQAEWRLSPSLYRCHATARHLLNLREQAVVGNSLHQHCSIAKQSLRYAFALRKDTRPLYKDDEQMWALAQHHGARTPLLDWTRAPLVAVFFALADYIERLSGEAPEFGKGAVVVWGLWQGLFDDTVSAHNDIIKQEHRKLEFGLVESMFPGNARIIAQQGVFTFFSSEVPIEDFTRNNNSLLVKKGGKQVPVLHRVEIPNKLAMQGLTSLNRMGINYRTLFPDVEGACRHANLDAILPNYQGMIPLHDKTIDNLGDSRQFLDYRKRTRRK